MKRGFSVPTQGSEERFVEVLTEVLEQSEVSLASSKVSVNKATYGVDQAYSFEVQSQEVGRIMFIPAGTRRNVIRVPDNNTGEGWFPNVDPSGLLFDGFVVQLMGQLYRQGLIPRPPQDL